MVSKTQQAHDAEVALDGLLVDVPEMTPVTAMRQAQRSQILRIAGKLAALEGEGDLDGISPTDPRFGALLDVLDEADELMYSLAKDKDAYTAWASTSRVSALFGRLTEQAGE